MKNPPDHEPNRPSVRERVRRHLRRLVVAGTATGAALQLAACPVVCDPLPPPLECASDPSMYTLLEHAFPSATWAQVEGQWVVQVSIDIQLLHNDDALAFTGPPELTDATLLGETHTGSHLELSCVPTPGATSVEVQIPTSCDGGVSHVHFALDVWGTPATGATIPVTAIDD